MEKERSICINQLPALRSILWLRMTSLLLVTSIRMVVVYDEYNACDVGPSLTMTGLPSQQACFSSWGCTESDTTEWLNWTELNWSSLLQVANVLKFQLRHQSFQEYSGLISFRIDWFPCCPRDTQESSPAPQFKSISSSKLSLLYGPTLPSVHDYRKNHRTQ